MIKGNWDNTDSLKSRIIVAGGYGGTKCRSIGGAGGGKSGTTRTIISGDCVVDDVCIADQNGCTGGADRSKKGSLGKGATCPK